MYSKFCSTNLPWKDESCKHILSGLSGIFYLMPICLCTGTFLDNIAWIMQAILSIMADYLYIQHSHFIHGVDKVFAVFNISRIMIRVYPIASLTPAIPMLMFFALSHYFKIINKVHYWIYCHFCWHLVGGLTCTYGMYLLNSNEII